MFELVLGCCKKDPDLVFKILIGRIQIQPNMDWICNPAYWRRGKFA